MMKNKIKSFLNQLSLAVAKLKTTENIDYDLKYPFINSIELFLKTIEAILVTKKKKPCSRRQVLVFAHEYQLISNLDKWIEICADLRSHIILADVDDYYVLAPYQKNIFNPKIKNYILFFYQEYEKFVIKYKII